MSEGRHEKRQSENPIAGPGEMLRGAHGILRVLMRFLVGGEVKINDRHEIDTKRKSPNGILHMMPALMMRRMSWSGGCG
jgi:hypothetical protein